MQYGVAIVILIVPAAATITRMITGYYMGAGIPYSVRIEPVLCTEILRLSRSVE